MRVTLLLSLVVATLMDLPRAHAITLGQVDDFEDGTGLGWVNGTSAPDPSNIATGGPAGAGDNFLQVTSDGAGAGGKLVTFNQKQWIGNYLQAGVTGIELDLKNFGTTPLSIRLALKTGSGSAAGYVSKTPFALPADSEWHHAVLALDAVSLTRVNSSTLTLAALLAKPGELRLIHSTTVKSTGDQLTGKLGIDNIRAVPEPASVLLASTALAACLLLRRLPLRVAARGAMVAGRAARNSLG